MLRLWRLFVFDSETLGKIKRFEVPFKPAVLFPDSESLLLPLLQVAALDLEVLQIVIDSLVALLEVPRVIFSALWLFSIPRLKPFQLLAELIDPLLQLELFNLGFL